ncbi:glycoside hydrolase family 3 C-terminal domain-containing protein [Radiobacillus sp. PE A8.2]|uniref:glycoside hydrolase family 3 C-terminal domain-containing protein n=1 Tax=Radiobacillus sp. PE A8.2 TaxID=3380349 RepID=UPI00388F782D
MNKKDVSVVKKRGYRVSIFGILLSLLTLIVYTSYYGRANTSMDSMSWIAFWLLIVGIVLAGAFLYIKRVLVPVIMSLFHFLAFLYFLYAMYPYISAAFVGIDSTWQASFFITLILFVVGLIVNLVGVFRVSSIKKFLVKASVPVTAVLLGIMLVGTTIATENAPAINSSLNTPTFKWTNDGDSGKDYEYYPSKFKNIADLKKAGQELVEKVMGEGAVLLKNQNNALPLNSDERSVSLFSISSVDPAYGGSGSGHVDASSAPTFKQAFERENLLDVNDTLWDWYSASEQAQYKRQSGSTGPGVTGIKVIGEAPWSEVDEANGSSFTQFGDAAIVVLTRVGGEGSDLPRGTLSLSTLDDSDGSAGDSTDGDYLKLSPKERELLSGLKMKKDAGIFKKIIVLLNYANQVEAGFIDDSEYGIDAALWIGMPGQTGLYGVAEILAGNINPSGKLSTTFWKSHDKNPVLANFGVTAYEGAPNAVNNDGSPNQDTAYVVYQEGIYLGYKYTETRYEDYAMGVENSGEYDYTNTVSYPFGYGKSYSDFEYSNFKTEKSGTGSDAKYTVSVDVTNNGPYSGKETVQIYLQKPYGTYNKQNGVEAASVELVGFAKTTNLDVNEKETVHVVVDERQFASYDSKNAKTYILTEGDYYLTAARDSHDAINNILAQKGYTKSNTSNRMDADGNKDLVSSALQYDLDTTKYTHSVATNAEITNQFDFADYNKYENRGNESVTYITRSNWVGTTPESWGDGVVLHWNEHMQEDLDALGRQGEIKLPTVDTEYPAYETYDLNENGKKTKLKLMDLRVDSDGNKIEYDDQRWEQLLDQLSWEDYANLIPTGMRRTGQINSISKPETLDHNGPTGLTEPYSAGPSGLATRLEDPDKNSKPMNYPSNGILAATFNIDLMYEVGNMIGEDALWAGYNGLYGPGSNIQRTPYSGRNFEYYSEDGFLTGKMVAYEAAAMEGHGLYLYNKHIGLNDQEDLRRGISVWANEQSIREIYMRAFELPITIEGTQYNYNGDTVTLDGASGVMLAFNRMGLYWSGMNEGLSTNFLRKELGMDGIIVTDMWYGTASPYMNLPALLVAGGNLVDGIMYPEHLDGAKPGTGHADVAWAMREAMHRILYTTVHSNAMNGISPDAEIINVTPWWQSLLKWTDIILGILLAASIVWTIITLINIQRKKQPVNQHDAM